MAPVTTFNFDLLNHIPRTKEKIGGEVRRYLEEGGSREDLVRQFNAAYKVRSGLFHVFGDPGAMPFIELFHDYSALAAPALLSAVKQEEAGLVDLYLSRNADPDEGNEWGLPLLEATRLQQPELAYDMTRRLLDAGADPNVAHYTNGYTALMCAAGHGYAPVVELLLQAGADVRRTCIHGETALHKVLRPVFACFGGGRHEDGDPVAVAKMLLEHGADVHSRSFGRYTPLHALASHGTSYAPQLIQVLLDAGANLEAKLPDGMTPLLVAAQSNSSEAITALLDAGANADATSKYGTGVGRLGGAETRRLVKSLQMARRVEKAMGDGDVDWIDRSKSGPSLTL